MGPFEAGFVSQRDNKQYDRKIMCTDGKIVYCFRVGGCCVLGTLLSSGKFIVIIALLGVKLTRNCFPNGVINPTTEN